MVQDGPHVLGNRAEHHVDLTAPDKTVPLCDLFDRVCRDVRFDLLAALQAEPVVRSRTDPAQHQLLPAGEAGELGGMRLESVAHCAITELYKRLRQTLLLQCG